MRRLSSGALRAASLAIAIALLPGLLGSPCAASAGSSRGAQVSGEDTAAVATEGAKVRGLCVKLEEGGAFIIELYPEKAPLAVARITELVEQGFYDGLEFHRVESFLVQTGRRDHELPPVEGEMFSQRLWHEEGMVGMARLPNGYDTATTQFYIMKERRTGLNGEYTLFGRVIEGMEAVHKIKKGHKIESVTYCEL